MLQHVYTPLCLQGSRLTPWIEFNISTPSLPSVQALLFPHYARAAVHPCIWGCLCVWVDDLDSRWVNSQVCPSFSGRIRGRWDWAGLDVSRLMSFPSLTSAATAAAQAKLETGTQSWLTFTRLIYIVPQMYHAIMPCQLCTNFGRGMSIDVLFSSAIKTWFCSWEFIHNFFPPALLLPLAKSSFNIQSVFCAALVAKGTPRTSQRINIMTRSAMLKHVVVN